MQNVLFLCSGNSARSLLAEALLAREGEGRFRAYSAGIEPREIPNPWALQLLEREGFDIGTFRCKTWKEFNTPFAPKMDQIITICEKAPEDLSSSWPGNPVTAQWTIPDPAAEVGDDKEMQLAFEEVYNQIADQVQRLVSLPLEEMDKDECEAALSELSQPSGRAKKVAGR
ncbi:arsenate reductase ArsC [uncultured Cohaesibacter sp.]|uniref:arsenate reductase ArsC n=1 Tax=uncultured Cohaesibacter sp. TaxID=1002546 RepID=UPI0029C9A73D|nr:arsenate reductase ArsC [uncultured Cohaesibacter sp.]